MELIETNAQGNYRFREYHLRHQRIINGVKKGFPRTHQVEDQVNVPTPPT